MTPEKGDLADPQMAWMVARALAVVSNQQSAAAAVSPGIKRHLLENGLMSKAQSYQGRLDASYQAERLRMAEGLPTKDERLRQGLEGLRTQLFSHGTALDRATWLATYRLAGGTVSAPEEESVLQAASEAFTRNVTLQNVQIWAQQVDVLQVLDEPIPAFTVEPWAAQSPEARSARNVLVLGLSRAGRLGLLADRPAAAQLLTEADEQLKAGTVTAASLALDAASAVGWVTDAATSQRMKKQLDARTLSDTVG
ncbi:hypothetical protein [Streptomyces sp. MUM 2J]|uniref:hypothetical protein n=1 Tax=Streptomyces sp. MUM 2J TaxID=2791987 RepID=UPI001F0393A3|nr:hypothetical protein [Streptomyces sp. MUM 2J]MCH0567618.1 hypothetical protein [Streptomyces sp. MUM 2J]